MPARGAARPLWAAAGKHISGPAVKQPRPHTPRDVRADEPAEEAFRLPPSRSGTFNSSTSSTSSSSRYADPEFKAWFDTLTDAQKLTVMDSVEVTDYTEDAEDAILAIQTSGEKSDATWKAAAAWTLTLSDDMMVEHFLRRFGAEYAVFAGGLKPEAGDHPRLPPSRSGSFTSTTSVSELYTDTKFKSWFEKLSKEQKFRVMDHVETADYEERVKLEATEVSRAPPARTGWLRKPKDSGASLHLDLNSHMMAGGHKWYEVHCTIKGRNMKHTKWTAPRRLVQISDLHDRVKDMLGESYDTLFGESQFGSTTVRIGSWLVRLANMITNGEVPPSVAAVTLCFFQAPAPDTTPVLEEMKMAPLASSALTTAGYKFGA